MEALFASTIAMSMRRFAERFAPVVLTTGAYLSDSSLEFFTKNQLIQSYPVQFLQFLRTEAGKSSVLKTRICACTSVAAVLGLLYFAFKLYMESEGMVEGATASPNVAGALESSPGKRRESQDSVVSPKKHRVEEVDEASKHEEKEREIVRPNTQQPEKRNSEDEFTVDATLEQSETKYSEGEHTDGAEKAHNEVSHEGVPDGTLTPSTSKILAERNANNASIIKECSEEKGGSEVEADGDTGDEEEGDNEAVEMCVAGAPNPMNSAQDATKASMRESDAAIDLSS